MTRKIILAISALTAVSVLGGCVIVVKDIDDHDDGYEYSSSRNSDSLGAGTMLTDVRQRFDNDEFLRHEPLLIAAKDGVVTLSGEVTDAQAIDRAVELASRTPGVESVVLKVVLLMNP